MTARSRPSFVRPSSASQLRPNPESLTSGTVRPISTTPEPDETPEPRTTTEGSNQTVTEPAEDLTTTPPAPPAPPAKAQPLKRRARRVAQSARPPAADESDLPMPPPKHDDTVMVNFSSRLDTDLNDRFYEFVQQHRTTVQAVLNQALDEYLSRRGA